MTDILDKTQPFDLKDILGEQMVRSLEQAKPEWNDYSELEMKEYLKPTETDFKLRVAFSVAIEKFMDPNHPEFTWKKIPGRSLYDQICSATHFYNKVVHSPRRVFYITRPFQKTEDANEANAKLAMMRLGEILNLSYWKDETKTDWCTKKVGLILTASKEALNRRFGTSIERIAAVHRLTNDKTPVIRPESIGNPLSIDEQIRELQAKLSPAKLETSLSVPETLDAEIQEDTIEPAPTE